MRFPERLRVEVDLPRALETALVPGMILQPLVENAVRYGVAPVARAVTIRIAARADGPMLVLEVGDDGPGGSDADGGFGIGLANVRDRLAARHGEEASLRAGPHPQGGWLAEIRLPLDRDA